jgi:hypothetical protein
MTIKRQIQDDVKKECSCTFFEMILEDNLLFSPITTQMEGCKLEKLKVKDHKPT